MYDDSDEGPEVIVRREYENLGYPINNNESDREDTFKRDPNGCSPDDKKLKKIFYNGAINHGDSASYGEAVKAIECKDPLDANCDVAAYYTCCFCGLVFKHPKRFLIHYAWHSYGKPYDPAALEAPKRVNKKKKKTEGEKRDDDEKDENGSFECDICNQVYRSRRSMQNHRTRLHFATPKECKVCHKTFNNSGYLNSHMMTHTEGKKFMCSQCPKTFKFMHSLQRHIPTHLEVKNYPCSGCDKSFGSDLLLKIHSKTHLKPIKGKSLKCSFCPKTFYQGFSLVAHERTHTGERPFECHLCKQKYPTNSSLSRHLKVSHGGHLPFECEFCGRSFHIRSAWDYHIRRAHYKERPHSCEVCNNTFICRSELLKHQKKAHETVDDSMLVGHNIEDAPSTTKNVTTKRKARRRRRQQDGSDISESS